MIYSFDVFDTLITRLCAHPDTIFYIIQKELNQNSLYSSFDSQIRTDFISYRKYAENVARQSSTKEDVSIVNIYEQLQKDFLLSNADMNILMQLELDTELAYSVPINENINKVQDLLKHDETVIFISDMYLRSQDIRLLLNKHFEVEIDNCPIYVSSEHGLTKSRGSLFTYVLNDLNVDPSQIMHTGDNLKSDIMQAKKKGLMTCFYSKTGELDSWLIKNCNMYGDDLKSKKNPDIYIHWGICRYLLLEEGIDSFVLLAGFITPFLIAFLNWLQDEISDSQDVFFLARDGEFLLELAEYMNLKNANYHYLPISRQAVVPAACSDVDGLIEYLFRGYPHVNIRMLCTRCEMDYIQLADMCGSLPNPDTFLSKKQIGRLKTVLNQSEPFLNYAKEFIEQKKHDSATFLSKFIKDNNLYFVDLGWKGTIQDALKELFPDVLIHGYYYGVSDYGKVHSESNRRKVFHFYPGSSLTKDKIKLCIVFLELMCSSNKHVITGYRNGNVVYDESVISKDWIPSARRIGKRYMDYVTEIDFPFNWHSIIDTVLNTLNKPGKDLANRLGDLKYSADPLDTDNLQLAPAIKIFSLFKGQLNSSWYQGRVARSNFFVRRLFKIRKAGITLLRKIICRIKKNN